MRRPAGGHTRRTFLGYAAATAGCGLSLGAAAAPEKPKPRTRLILLGTKGGPTPSVHRAAASSLLLVDSQPYVIDCGNGVASTGSPGSS